MDARPRALRGAPAAFRGAQIWPADMVAISLSGAQKHYSARLSPVRAEEESERASESTFGLFGA